jgi:hypothetical protein
MARRKKSGPAEELVELVTMLPWWAGVALGLVSYLLLNQIAAQPLTVNAQPGHASMAVQGLWKGLTSAGQYILPIICLVAAGVLVQCKQWRALKVGVGVVRELYGVMSARGATGGFVVTSGQFTDDAISFASGRNVKLVDGPKLVGLIRQAKSATVRPTPSSCAAKVVPLQAGAGQAIICPVCAKSMVRRTAKRCANAGREFWGCTGYPDWRGTRPIG